MRFHSTIEHEAAQTAYREARAAAEAFAEIGDDGTAHGGSAVADEAYSEDYAKLDALMLFQAITPKEVRNKIRAARQRDALDSSWTRSGEYLDRIERDMLEMTRPNVSPTVAEAFNEWAEAHELYMAAAEGETSEAAYTCEGDRRTALMRVACTTPGDFIAKAYAGLMARHGPAMPKKGTAAFHPFVLSTNMMDEDERQQVQDITDSDLGCCMIALGRTDFDAQRWIETAIRAGKSFALVGDGEALGLSVGMRGDSPLGHLLSRLLANGLDEIADERVNQVIRALDEAA